MKTRLLKYPLLLVVIIGYLFATLEINPVNIDDTWGDTYDIYIHAGITHGTPIKIDTDVFIYSASSETYDIKKTLSELKFAFKELYVSDLKIFLKNHSILV